MDLKSIRRNDTISAPRLLVYGVEGIGKSTFAAGAPNPIFILTEDGLGSLPVQHFPLATSTDDIMGAISTLYGEAHNFGTVVVDSLDWLEAIVQREVEEKHDAKELAYGKGAIIAAEKWRMILEGLNALRQTGAWWLSYWPTPRLNGLIAQKWSRSTVTNPSCKSGPMPLFANGAMPSCLPTTRPS